MIEQLEALVLKASDAVMQIYRRGDIDVQTKGDQTPVTEADILAHQIIVEGLAKLSPLPIISEEAVPETYAEEPVQYWLVDPIDGTQEFIRRRPTFTVNIALIENGVPVAGIIAAPERNELYSAWKGILRKNGLPRGPVSFPHERTVLASLSHPEAQLAAFKERHAIASELRMGSSYKFCMMADGLAHFYPRFRSLSAWDIAAGDAIARAAGCRVLDLITKQDLRYRYKDTRVDPFCVVAPAALYLPS